MTSVLSINAKPYYIKDWVGCKAFLTQLDATVAVMAVDQPDHINRIREARNAAPNTRIVARFIDVDHDGSMHMKPQTTSDKYIVSPQNQLNRIREFGQGGLIAYWGNEPDTKAPIDDLERLASHTVEAMDLAATRDYDMSLCVGNFGIGHPQPVDGYLPTWMHPILQGLNRHRNRHYLGVHLYAPLNTLEFLNALKKTCDERLQIPMPRVIITEFGWDTDGGKTNGFKSRKMSNEVFAAWCINACQTDLRPFFESGDVIGACTFIYGDDASWYDFNVETAHPNEVSTAWRDVVLQSARNGELVLKKRATQTVPVVTPIPSIPPAPTVPIKPVITAAQIPVLEQWQGQLDFEINKHKAEIAMLTQRKTLIDGWLELAKAVTN